MASEAMWAGFKARALPRVADGGSGHPSPRRVIGDHPVLCQGQGPFEPPEEEKSTSAGGMPREFRDFQV